MIFLRTEGASRGATYDRTVALGIHDDLVTRRGRLGGNLGGILGSPSRHSSRRVAPTIPIRARLRWGNVDIMLRFGREDGFLHNLQGIRGIHHAETRHLFWYRRSACRRAASSLPSMSPTSLGVPNSVDDTSAWTVHPCHNHGL